MTLNTDPSTNIFWKNKVIDVSFYSPSSNIETQFDAFQKTSIRIKNNDQDNVTIENVTEKPSKADRIYPHFLDQAVPEGEALFFIKNALNDAQIALDAFGDPDLHMVMTHLTQIAATMGRIHPLTNFNESLGGVVSYIRRATLSVTIDEISRPSLNALITALQSLISNPMLGLYDACEIVEKLSNEGWHGEHAVTETLIAALFDELDIEPNTESSKLIEDLLREQ